MSRATMDDVYDFIESFEKSAAMAMAEEGSWHYSRPVYIVTLDLEGNKEFTRLDVTRPNPEHEFLQPEDLMKLVLLAKRGARP